MTDTEIVDEILRLLHKENAGHFDRLNMLDALYKVNFDINNQDNDDGSDEISRIKRIVDRAISELEEV